MPNENRSRPGDPWSLMWRIVREVFDALLLIVVLISIAFMVYYLQIPPENRPSISDLIPGGTESLTSQPTATGIPTRVSLAPPVQTLAPTQTFTVTPAPTLTPRPTNTPAVRPVITVTLVNNSVTGLTLETEMNDGMEHGDRIVQAIEAYNQDKGFYPPALADLVPGYLPELPLTGTGQAFFYRVFERTTVMSPEIYWVSFRVVSQNNVTCTYYRRLQYWDCNFSSP